MIIQKRLQKDGHEVTLAEHGGQAIRAFESDVVFDIILMDLQMPIVNGYEAAAHIRGLEAKFRPSGASIFISLSSFADGVYRRRSYALGTSERWIHANLRRLCVIT